MPRVMFSETSRRWANQLNDLRERWHLRREEPVRFSVPTHLFAVDIDNMGQEQLLNLKADLIDFLNKCKYEIGKAQDIAANEGVYMDRAAYNDLVHSKSSAGNHIQIVNHALGRQRRAQARSRDFPQHFIDVCRERLPKELYLEIRNAARIRAQLDNVTS